jgi:hypothetical protein
MAATLENLRLPCQDGSLVHLDHLPDDVQGVVQFLESEGVPLSYWWDMARAYLAQGRTGQYLAILQSALEDDLLQAVEDYFKKRPTFEIVQLLCGYAAHHIEQYRQESDKATRQQHLGDAAARIIAAKNEGPDEQLPYLAAGVLALAKVWGGGGPGRGPSGGPQPAPPRVAWLPGPWRGAAAGRAPRSRQLAAAARRPRPGCKDGCAAGARRVAGSPCRRHTIAMRAWSCLLK